MEETARLHLEPMEMIGENTKNRLGMKDSVQAQAIDVEVWRRQRTRAVTEQKEKMKTQHKAPWFRIQAKVHTRANKSREVRNKGCHSNLGEPRCATGCSTHGPSIKGSPHPNTRPCRDDSAPLARGMRTPAHTLTSLSLFFPPPLKIQANSTQSLPSLSQQLPL